MEITFIWTSNDGRWVKIPLSTDSSQFSYSYPILSVTNIDIWYGLRVFEFDNI